MNTDQNDPLYFFRVIATLGFFATLLAGIYLSKNSARLFGVTAEIPSESSSDRTYTKLLVFAAWAHAMVLFGAGALNL
ncbi:MAG: hypothetical protein WCD79_08570 [Chthoniobacteraceae bacterium]